jgi:hypothetical protein
MKLFFLIFWDGVLKCGLFEYIAYAYMTPEGNHGELPLRAARDAMRGLLFAVCWVGLAF